MSCDVNDDDVMVCSSDDGKDDDDDDDELVKYTGKVIVRRWCVGDGNDIESEGITCRGW